jgi:hypothetical protein
MLPDGSSDRLGGCSLKKTDAANPTAAITAKSPMQSPALRSAVPSMNLTLA